MDLLERDCMTAQEQEIHAQIEKLLVAEPGRVPEIAIGLRHIHDLTSAGNPRAAAIAGDLLAQLVGTDALTEDQWLDNLIRLQAAVLGGGPPETDNACV